LANTRTPNSPNHYIRLALSYALAYLPLNSIQSAKITIHADNDYYSQSSSPTFDHLRSLPRFNKLNTPITKANKTGLGSSAALITAITAAIIASYSDVDITSGKGKQIVHNLAQASHCAAQGKVGSGFDVAAAVYGSCVYRRFLPEVLEKVWLHPHWTTNTERYDLSCRNILRDTVNEAWSMEFTPFQLPKGLRIVMGDVAAGSATPGMVKSVLKWKASGPGAMELWTHLGSLNRILIQLFNELKDFPNSIIIEGAKRRSPPSDASIKVQETLSGISEVFSV
jgi:phosphomevalonate kinase